MKKVICLLLTLSLALVALTSCGAQYDIENADLGAYVKLGDLTTFTYEEICENYEAYRESLSSQTSSFYPTTGYTLDYFQTAELVEEDGTLTPLASLTHNTESDMITGHEMFREDADARFDNALAYDVEDASTNSTTQRLVEMQKEFSFTMTMGEDISDTTLSGKTVQFTISVQKVLPAVYTDSYISDALLSFFNAVSTDKEIIEAGDTVTLNYTATVDGAAFDGSTGSNFVIVVGEGTLWDELESALIGHKNGETFNTTVTFSADEDEAIAGKEAAFEVTVKNVYNDNHLIEDNTPFSDLWELKYALRVKSFAEYALFDIVLDRSEALGYPEELLDQFEDIYTDYVKSSVSSAVEYYASLGETYTKSEMKEALYPDGSDKTYVESASKEAAFSYMVLVCAEKELGVTYSEEDYQADLQKMAESYADYYEEEISTEELEEEYGEVILRMSFLQTKLTNILMERIVNMPNIPQAAEED